MNFCENLINLRKKNNLSQEQLATKLDVSRQAVSKWESGASYPEMDKLIILCDIFGCTMDELVKGTIKIDKVGSKEIYTKFYNQFSLAIATGVSLILLGITVMLGLYSFMEKTSVVPVSIFMLFVLIAVSIFILFGLRQSDFNNQNAEAKNPYSKNDYIKELSSSFNMAMVIGVALILIGVIFLILTVDILDNKNFDFVNHSFKGNYIPIIIFMLLITVSVFLFVYFGIRRMKYDNNYNNEYKIDKEKEEKYSAIIMIIATMIYLVLGFLFNWWHPGWVVFPIGGMLCGIVEILLRKSDND